MSARQCSGLLDVLLRIVLAIVVIPLFAHAAGEMNSTILIGGSRIHVVIEDGPPGLSNDALLRWVRRAAESVTAYYGHFPLPEIVLRIAPVEGRGVRGGRTFGEGGGRIFIHVGVETTEAGLQSDWMLTHEMVHLSFPSVAEEHHWIEEGLSTYVEPIARVQAKQMDAAEMWFELVRDLHQGLPQDGDEGLDHTHTWGRTYWGGALYCFLADLEIRKQTHNKKGLQDALRGILNAGGDIREDWDLEKALRTGDQAIGVSVLVPLYEEMKGSPHNVDLDALWKQLGLKREGDSVGFDNNAPLAATRIAITRGTPAAGAKTSSDRGGFTTFAGRTSRNPRSRRS